MDRVHRLNPWAISAMQCPPQSPFLLLYPQKIIHFSASMASFPKPRVIMDRVWNLMNPLSLGHGTRAGREFCTALAGHAKVMELEGASVDRVERVIRRDRLEIACCRRAPERGPLPVLQNSRHPASSAMGNHVHFGITFSPRRLPVHSVIAQSSNEIRELSGGDLSLSLL